MKLFMIFLTLLAASPHCEKRIEVETDWIIGKPELTVKIEPLFIENDVNDLVTIQLSATGSEVPLYLNNVEVSFTDRSAVESLASISLWYTGIEAGPEIHEFVAESRTPEKVTILGCSTQVSSGINQFVIGFNAKPEADLAGIIAIESLTLTFSDGSRRTARQMPEDPVIRFGKILRAAGQDGSDTYRIPGLARTKTGTLIAVYDVRYLNSKDLQGDIDVGMSRSTDGGQTWEKMKVIMDMDEYGGKPEAENGVGDPCVLVDDNTGTIWVAALWLTGFPGQAAWNASGPGLEPGVTGQLLLVRSDDDGVNWSEEINITSQVKLPSWRLLLQGPGNGITLKDGTLVFPAQFKDADGLPHSTIMHSSDYGVTWHIGTGAKENTTEAQCVQLGDGSVMLNMRDNRNNKVKDNTNGRAVAITRDLGETWQVHPSTNSALPEPVCMASLIASDIDFAGTSSSVLFFSNPNDRNKRAHMTVKASLDEGLTWPEKFWIELNESLGYGYSCLTIIDNDHIGILYEGKKELYFQKIPVNDFFDN